ncbi:MAG: hypothetical protein M3160_03405 [Candidatus Eremiobacteraeota bacterium]|nr:hypothetical protein [Candidatus Eremiobacteraeota bacterium]
MLHQRVRSFPKTDDVQVDIIREFCNDERGLGTLGMGDGPLELWPVIQIMFLPGFNLFV